jgi:hypothetical protein
MQESRLVTPYLSPTVASGTQLNRQPEELLASPDGEQGGNSDSDPDNMNEGSSPVVNAPEEMSEPRRSEDGGLADLVMEQLEEEDIDQGTRERVVERVVRLVSARLGAQLDEVPPSYASQR